MGPSFSISLYALAPLAELRAFERSKRLSQSFYTVFLWGRPRAVLQPGDPRSLLTLSWGCVFSRLVSVIAQRAAPISFQEPWSLPPLVPGVGATGSLELWQPLTCLCSQLPLTRHPSEQPFPSALRVRRDRNQFLWQTPTSQNVGCTFPFLFPSQGRSFSLNSVALCLERGRARPGNMQ